MFFAGTPIFSASSAPCRWPGEPIAGEPYVAFAPLAFSTVTSSAKFFAGLDGGTSSTPDDTYNSEMNVKSLTGSNGRFCIAGTIVCMAPRTSSSV